MWDIKYDTNVLIYEAEIRLMTKWEGVWRRDGVEGWD